MKRSSQRTLRSSVFRGGNKHISTYGYSWLATVSSYRGRTVYTAAFCAEAINPAAPIHQAARVLAGILS